MKQGLTFLVVAVIGVLLLRWGIVEIYEQAETSRIQNDIANKQAIWNREKEKLNAQGIE